MPAPKIEFYTPATFKSLAQHVVQVLSKETGILWRLHGVQKSNRKLEGDTRELSLSAKLQPQDPQQPWSADLYATLNTFSWGDRFSYLGGIAVEHRMRTVFSDTVTPKTIGEITHWATNLKLPAHVIEDAKKTATLVERVAHRYLRSLAS